MIIDNDRGFPFLVCAFSAFSWLILFFFSVSRVVKLRSMSFPLVIVNPASADGATRENWPKIASDLRTHFGPFTVAFTEGTGHGRQLAAEAATTGTKLIIACGGDGTISEVANGIIESN